MGAIIMKMATTKIIVFGIPNAKIVVKKVEEVPPIMRRKAPINPKVINFVLGCKK
jgi:hypothetical protein